MIENWNFFAELLNLQMCSSHVGNRKPIGNCHIDGMHMFVKTMK